MVLNDHQFWGYASGPVRQHAAIVHPLLARPRPTPQPLPRERFRSMALFGPSMIVRLESVMRIKADFPRMPQIHALLRTPRNRQGAANIDAIAPSTIGVR
jgi:hypothetical protein